MHACRLARGHKWSGKEVVNSEACGLFAGDIEREAETWCKRGSAGEEGKKGPLAGRGGESNERLKPTYSKGSDVDSMRGLRVFATLAHRCMRGLERVSSTSPMGMGRRYYRACRAADACAMRIVFPLVGAQRPRDLTVVVCGPGYPMASDG